MISSRIKVITILVLILITLISCTHRENMAIDNNQVKQANEEASYSLSLEKDSQVDQSAETSTNNLNQDKDNQVDQSIKVSLKSISQEEYDKWVIPRYHGGLDPNGQPLKLPEIERFDYPYVEGMEDKELQKKVNKTIKKAIFNEEFLIDGPISAVGVETTPLSYFEFPGLIYNNEILSIPIVLYWNRPHSYYKAISVTIDMKTGERLFLEDIIELNKELAYKILYEEDFFVNIDIVGSGMKEDLNHFSNGDEELPSEASKNLLDILRINAEEDEKPQVEDFYLTKDGIVLTRFTNNGTPAEINVPLENLHKFLKIKSWKSAESIESTDSETKINDSTIIKSASILTTEDFVIKDNNNYIELGGKYEDIQTYEKIIMIASTSENRIYDIYEFENFKIITQPGSDANSSIGSIDLTTPIIKTSRGIKVGDTISDVIEMYGKPIDSSVDDSVLPGQYIYQYNGKFITFFVNKTGQVVLIRFEIV